MVSEFRAAKLWVAANIVGAAAFLRLAAITWIEPELRHEQVARGGDAVVWASTALPVLISFLVLNLLWATRVLVKVAKTGALRTAAPIALMGLVWLGAILLDVAMR